MTDRELNEKIARLCGITVLTGDHPIGPYPCICCNGELHTTDEDALCKCEPWNPVESWNQVHDYVIPAVRKLGCNVHIDFTAGDTGDVMWIEIDKVGGLIATGEAAVSVDVAPPARLFCEVALKAFEKLAGNSVKKAILGATK